MRNLIDFYKTQVRILWEWRGGRWAMIKRLVITLLVSALSLILTAGLLPGVTIGRVLDAIVAVVLMALLNAVVRPVLLVIVACRSLVLLAVLVLVLQVVAFLVIAPLAGGVNVNGFLTALIASSVYAPFNTALTAILGVDRDGSYFGLLVSSLMTRGGAAPYDKPVGGAPGDTRLHRRPEPWRRATCQGQPPQRVR